MTIQWREDSEEVVGVGMFSEFGINDFLKKCGHKAEIGYWSLKFIKFELHNYMICSIPLRRLTVGEPDQKSTAFDITSLRNIRLFELLRTKFRELEAKYFAPLGTVVTTTDFEALYAYKRGDYRRCLRLSTENILAVIDCSTCTASGVHAYPEFLPLMDDDTVSLTGLTLVVQPSCREDLGLHVTSRVYTSGESAALSDGSVSDETTVYVGQLRHCFRHSIRRTPNLSDFTLDV